MRGLLAAKLGAVVTAVAAMSGCIGTIEYDETDGGWSSQSWTHESRPTRHNHSSRDAQGCVQEPDPINITESRDVLGTASKHWTWNIPACVVEYLKVKVVLGAADPAPQAMGARVDIQLRDPRGQTVAELDDVGFFSSSETVLDYSIGPNATVPPGRWKLDMSTTGVLHYDVEVRAKY